MNYYTAAVVVRLHVRAWTGPGGVRAVYWGDPGTVVSMCGTGITMGGGGAQRVEIARGATEKLIGIDLFYHQHWMALNLQRCKVTHMSVGLGM